ncbi:MAG: elongation factor G [Syntrophomonadaceae bacterium]|nr:elongation factor G [Syntrophomonadaceae bacterium]
MRNIGIIAHIDAGKTTTSERILYYTGETYKVGETHDGQSTMDFLPQEKERGITIASAATTCSWKGVTINIVDTPGHVDFTAEVERSLRVLDGAVVIFCGKGGVEPQSETVWRQADKYRVPRIAYINKMDAIGADYKQVMEQMRHDLGANPVLLTMPYITEEDGLQGAIDIITQEYTVFEGELGVNMIKGPIPADAEEDAVSFRQTLIEVLANNDDEILDLFIENLPVPNELITKAIRNQTLVGELVPVLCGSSYRNVGVQLLLDAVINYLPSPTDVGGFEATEAETGLPVMLHSDENEDFAGLVFKIVADRHVGKLAFIRIYSGQLKAGSYVYHVNKGRREHVGRILRMHADHREEVQLIKAGEIAAIIGLENVSTGDTLSTEENPVLLENIEFPEPVISIAIEPKNRMDQVRISEALAKLSAEDPTFRASVNQETGQTLISGMGELHLEVITERLIREFKIDAALGQPQVAYKETISRMANGECRFVKQTGGCGPYAHVKLTIEPAEETSVEFKIVGGAIPREYFNAIEAGAREALLDGPIKGFPLVNVKITVLDGSFHEVDSSEMAFKMAGLLGVKDAVSKAGPQLLEPIMKLEITAPDEFTGNIINNLNSKRGRLESMDTSYNTQIIRGFVPMAELFGYSTAIRSITQGRAAFNMQFSHYEACMEASKLAV